MPPKPKSSKREAILDAMLDVVVERGFHEAPMSLISARSGASAGLIYHHFASKEEIIQALYQRIHGLKNESFLKGFSPEMDAKQAFIQACENLYGFYRKHQREMRFLEMYKNSGFVCQPPESSSDERTAAFMQRFSNRSKGGVLNDWPVDVLEEMTVGLVARLARLPRKLPGALLREIAKNMWEAVRAK